MFFKLKKGLDLPVNGQPDERIDYGGDITSVAVLGSDYIGLKPTMLVKVGDIVKVGTPLFEDKKNPGVIITSPAAGSVKEINRGAKRALRSVVIDVDGDDARDFGEVEESELLNLTEQQVRGKLQESGLWVALQTRPYGKVPGVDSNANSIFINAMDTNPLAVDPQIIINDNASEFVNGVTILSRFNIPVYICQKPDAKLPSLNNPLVKSAAFDGPHPAGLPSTHIHCIDPVNENKTVWSIGYQDVIAIGKLFVDGVVSTTRYVALGGPLANSPRILSTRLGADLAQLTEGRTTDGKKRIISGSLFNGHTAQGDVNYLGRYDNQVSVIEELDDREFMGWIAPGMRKYSAIRVFMSSIFKPAAYDFSTSQYGSPRAIVPIGVFEKVMPLDILPTPLLKAILVKDTDTAQKLGCLELVEEDLALCSFVDPGKHDFGPVLRSTLTQIEREG